MDDLIGQTSVIDQSIRVYVMAAVILLMALWEFAFPRRSRVHSRLPRWGSNFALQTVNLLMLHVAYRGGLVALAVSLPLFQAGCLLDFMTCGSYPTHIGIFGIRLPVFWDTVISLLILDFAIWGQHLLTHKIPWLWRLHLVHHSDADLDFSSGLRFHPFEIGFSFLYKALVIYVCNISPESVLVYITLLSAFSVFNHSNVAMPLGVDRFLRLFFATPDFHRVHHSVDWKELNSNYGNILSIWDRLFGTYVPQPAAGHEKMELGLESLRGQQAPRLKELLPMPFNKNVG